MLFRSIPKKYHKEEEGDAEKQKEELVDSTQTINNAVEEIGRASCRERVFPVV